MSPNQGDYKNLPPLSLTFILLLLLLFKAAPALQAQDGRLQKLRKYNPKGTILNLLYKEMGNSIYGNVVRVISNKKSFDTLTCKSFRVSGSDL